MKTEACPPESALDEFARGGLPQGGMDAVAAHVVRCRACDGRLAEFATGLPVTRVGPVPAVRPLGSNAVAGPVLVGGKYLLGDRLGAGGMGFVFKAEQTHPVRRLVAIKVIKPGMDTDEFLARFEAERRTVARMDHPNIARVYDAGATDDGRPYLALELIDGQPLVRYCDARKLTPARRAELFVPVCRAVQHAHQKGVIHRDLKPSNILVTEVDGKPVPKVIDFGIAKAVEGDADAAATRTGAVVGTPEYMSPEQAGLSGADIDTRSDVYSLGVVLYELLTGTPPFTTPDSGGSVLELLRRIREVDAPRPGSQLRTPDTATRAAAARGRDPERLRKELAGELEWVVMTALEKDRDRRYQSAAALADDLERYLRQEPLAAGPPSRRYRLRKFLLRNRRAVFAASAVTVALLAGTVGAVVGLVRSVRAERDAVEAHGREAEARVAAEAAAAQARADHEAAVRAGEEARRDREAAVAAQARTRAALLDFTDEVVGGLLGRAAQLTPDEDRFMKTVERRLAAFADETGQNDDDRAAAAECRSRLGTIQVRLGDLTAGKASLLAAADAMGRFTGDDPLALRVRSGLVGTAGELSALCLRTSKPAEAVGWMDTAVRVAEGLVHVAPTADHRGLLAQALGSRGNHLMRSGRADAAVRELTAAHALFADLYREEPTADRRRFDLASNHDLLGMAHDALRRDADAVREWRAAEQLLAPLVAGKSGEVRSRAALAAVLSQLARAVGRTDAGEADRCYRRAITLRRQLATDYPAVPQYRSDYAVSAANYASRLTDDGRTDDAGRFAADALAVRERLAADFPAVSAYQIYLAHSLVLSGKLARLGNRPERATELLDRAARLIGPAFEKEPNRPLAREIYGMCARERGELHDDAKQFTAAADDWRKFRSVAKPRDGSWATARLALSLAKAKRWEDAAAALKSLDRPDWKDAGWVIARAHAVIAAGVTDPAERERHAAAAVQALRKAAAGLENPAEARTEPDFAALRDRPDFRAVLDTLRERLPPPRSVRDEG